ncbi:MAG TPA: hypothetical protein VHY20_09885, partial [Pirellulales bacterium]|nr:hypothetical protein [Pirellulales bacterium]
MPRRWFFCVSGVLLLAGCSDYSKQDELLRGIRKLPLVDAPGIHFEASSIANTSGATDRMAETTVAGELIATDDARLPADLAQSVLDSVRAQLMSSGGTVGEEGGRNLIKASAA